MSSGTIFLCKIHLLPADNTNARHLLFKTLQGHLSSVLQIQFVNVGLQVLSVSSDGCLKSWELKTSSCLFTEECGNDKIWALDASSDGDSVVTGSADAILTVWRDITEEKVIQNIEKKNKLIEEEQRLNNLLNAKEWTRAFELALKLDRPFTLLKVVRGTYETFIFLIIIVSRTKLSRGL